MALLPFSLVPGDRGALVVLVPIVKALGQVEHLRRAEGISVRVHQLGFFSVRILIFPVKLNLLRDRDCIVDAAVKPLLQIFLAEGIFYIIVVIPKPVGILIIWIQISHLEGTLQADLHGAEAVFHILGIAADIERVIQQLAGLCGESGDHRPLHIVGSNRHFLLHQIQRDRIVGGDLQRPGIPAVVLVVIGAVSQGHLHGGDAFDGDVDMIDRMVDISGLRHRGHACQIDLGRIRRGSIATDPVVLAVDTDVFVGILRLDVFIGINDRTLLIIGRMLCFCFSPV